MIGPYDYGISNIGQLITDFTAHRIKSYVNGAYDFVDVRDVANGLIMARSWWGCFRASRLTPSTLTAILNGRDARPPVCGFRREGPPACNSVQWSAGRIARMAGGATKNLQLPSPPGQREKSRGRKEGLEHGFAVEIHARFARVQILYKTAEIADIHEKCESL